MAFKMTISYIPESEPRRYKVVYGTSQSTHTREVDEDMARLLEIARAAGAEDKRVQILHTLGL